MSDITSKPISVPLGESVAEQIIFIESWRDHWKRYRNDGAVRMAENVLRTLRAADEPSAALPHCPTCECDACEHKNLEYHRDPSGMVRSATCKDCGKLL